MSEIHNLPPNIPKIALVCGEHGLGKTNTIIFWGQQKIMQSISEQITK